MEPVQPVETNIYQSNTYRKDVSWLHFDDEPRVQERQQVNDQKSYIFIFVTYLTIPSNNWEDQPRHDNSRPYSGFREIQSNLRGKKLYRTTKGSNFLGGSFSNTDNVRAPIQFNPSILKGDFSQEDRLIFTSITPMLLDQSNETS